MVRTFGRLSEKLRNIVLGVPPGKTVHILLPLGVAAQPGQPREKLPFAQRAWFNRYGG